ncbi:Carboxylic acid reductase [Frankia canadensis]|uniref:Carboxylic acid reductase n=1 Tax=Frankia canadensis TaxID=1836972 RepID=A0A2I2L057_9ACTN|nr:carboxylic acid reductase [Frankia canadensis]SNQ51304.1 Carboxylic acid reductase [Frankia canadensis]SOU58594.1 Carboxylic acid reductase [Frankia canadensis]
MSTDRKIPDYARRILDLAAGDPQLQELLPDGEVTEAVFRPGQSLEDIVTTFLDGYASRPALGERDHEPVVDPATGRTVRGWQPHFGTISYRELRDRIAGLAAAWGRQHERHRVDDGEFVAFLGFSGTDYITADLATVYRRAVGIPLQSTMAPADLDQIVTNTEPAVIVATAEDLEVAAGLAATHPSVRSVVAMDYDPRVDDERDRFEAARARLSAGGTGAELITIDELIALGAGADLTPPGTHPAEDDRLRLLVHSSGSTGTPKGIIIGELYARSQFLRRTVVPLPVIRLIFAPMSHFMGRGAVYTTLSRGGTVYFTARPDMTTLFEDFALTRPTEANMFPRVLEMAHRRYLAELSRRLADRGLNTAAGTAATTGNGDSDGEAERIRVELLREMGVTIFGDRISTMMTGSAPTTPELRQFVAECFPAPLVDGYGTTEASGVTVAGRVNRAAVIDYRLRDVPELGYHSTDKPYPRGELLVKTHLGVPGYYKNPEATARLFDEDNFICTGDIMEERAPDHLVYIDRRNDVLKLAQGEFVTVGAVGNTFEAGSDVIHQIYVYGNSARAYLLAVVVPDPDRVDALLGPDAPAEKVRELVRSELARVAVESGLRSFEVPRDFLVETEPFSVENGLLSGMLKRLRPRLRDRYGPMLEELYLDLERKQNDKLVALRDPTSGLSVLDKVGKVLEASLGLADVDVTAPYSFAELGGDSLGAVAFTTLLSSVFEVDVPVNIVLSPAGNPRAWTTAIEELLGGRGRPTLASIHGAEVGSASGRLVAADLDITRFLPADLLAAAATEAPAGESRTVLLTGATGFLGRFLCLEWLERVAPLGGTVICLVRARDHAGAVARLHAAFSGDAQLEGRFRALAERHLEVVVGDVSEARLGLDDATWERLAGAVDRIVHPAALVNHVLDYEYLFGPNVVGTAELIALALTGRQKWFDFVSSLAVAPFLADSPDSAEDAPLRDTITLASRYVASYGASKWAAEQLLRSAHRRYGLPVDVFRGDMMLPHTEYAGQANTSDIFVRLLYSLVSTGVAPTSFYRRDAGAPRPRAHYDGLPVDFVAASIVGLSAEERGSGFRTFHVVNTHDDDGVSLDSFVDWIEAAGHPLERIDPYEDWLRRFEERLRGLPTAQRQASSLTVLDALRTPHDADRPTVGAARFAGGVRRLPIGPEIPHLTEAFLNKCLADMRHLGLL